MLSSRILLTEFFVIKHLRLHHVESALPRQNNVPRPPLPTETRWNSVSDKLQFFVEHWSNLVVVVNTITGPSDPIYRTMADIQLKRTAADLSEIFKTLSKALDDVQSDTCFIGECHQIWYNVRNKTPEQFAEITCKRHEKTVEENPVIFAINLLDHRFTGNNLDTEDVSNALNYNKDVDEQIVPAVMKFLSKAPPHNAPYLEGIFKDADHVVVEIWSQNGLQSKSWKSSISLLSAASSSRGLERCFSTLGTTYGKLRTSMGVDKAGKLVFIYRQMNKK